MSKGFPLLTTKKMYWKGIVTELLWFLRGDTNIKYLVDNDCHIWDGDAYKRYEQWDGSGCLYPEELTREEFINKIKTDDDFAEEWGDLGPVYGKQWRDWEYYCGGGDCNVDQIQNSINLLKTDPDSRRNIVSAWNVGELDKMTLPPCHNFFQFYTRELTIKEKLNYVRNKWPRVVNEDGWNNLYVDSGDAEEWLMTFGINEIIPQRAISLMYNARSQDVPLGTPFNIASYALLLVIIAKMVNMVPDELITNMGDCHIYKNQIDGIKEQLNREPYLLPKLVISDDVNFTGTIDEFLNSCSISDFKIEDYKSHPTIKMPLSN
jgi:thymidylate synthase